MNLKLIPLRFFLALGVSFVFLYTAYRFTTGFYYPDPVLFDRDAATRLLVYTLRVAIPFLMVSITSLAFLFALKIVSGKIVLLILAGSAFGGFIFVGLGAIAYVALQKPPNLTNYNSFLQLNPRECFDQVVVPGDTSIVMLGGSSTEWPDSQQKDWPSRVETILKEKFPDKGIKTFNCGRQWYTSLHSLLHFHANIARSKPKVIVVMQSINDLLHNADFNYYSIGKFRSDYGHFLGPSVEIVNNRPFLQSLFFRLDRTWNFPPRKIIDTDYFPGLPSFKENLRSLAHLAKANGSKVLFMSEPTLLKENLDDTERKQMIMINVEAIGQRDQWSLQTAVRGMQQYNKAVKEVADEEQLPFYDLDAKIPRTSTYFQDEVHYQDKAFPLVAERVADALIASHLVAP